MARIITYAQAINEALMLAMEQDQSVLAFGLGMNDPKRIFGTTQGLVEKFGATRVFDTPISENALTGIAVGASLNGVRPVMSHQRLDFSLLAMDQLVNNAAKWNYMFGGRRSVPITIRLVIGRGWGQGPQHSQNLQAMFAHIPGLKVVMPTTAYDAKGMLLSAIFDNNPVIYLEHRWLHNMESEVPEGDFRVPLDKAHLISIGENLTVVALSYMTVEAIHATNFLSKKGITCDLIDLRSVNPIDWNVIFNSVKKTGRLLVLDTATETLSVSSEIVARTAMECFDFLKSAPQRITLPDHPTPTSSALAKAYYPGAVDVAQVVGTLFNVFLDTSELEHSKTSLPDVPGDWFKGPF
jgi:acetoin:2,6-dichlorophenolindophenol oxidoreductase subunit beta